MIVFWPRFSQCSKSCHVDGYGLHLLAVLCIELPALHDLETSRLIVILTWLV